MPSSQTCMNIKASRPRAITGWPFFSFYSVNRSWNERFRWRMAPTASWLNEISNRFWLFFFFFYTTVVICNGFVSSWFRFTIMSSLLIFIDSIRKKWYSTDIFSIIDWWICFVFPTISFWIYPFFFLKSFEIDIYVHIERQFIIFSCVWWGLSF